MHPTNIASRRGRSLVATILIALALTAAGTLAAWGLGGLGAHAGTPDPQLSAAAHSGVVPTRPGKLPAYTLADVRDWIAHHPMHFYIGGVPAPILQSVAFVSHDQAEAYFKGEMLSATSVVVCVAIFAADLPPQAVVKDIGLPGHSISPNAQHYHRIVEVFDGATGFLGDTSFQF